MREELQAYLDGEIALEELPEELRGKARTWQEILSIVRAESPAEVPADLASRVMESIGSEAPARAEGRPAETVSAEAGEEARPGWRTAVEWLVRPRTIRVSPLAGALATAALVLVFVLAGGLGEAPQGPPEAARVYVQFSVEAPEARSVAVAGDFTGWTPRQVLQDVDGDGVWTGRVPLQPGVHEYMYVIDGERWVTDPRAERYVDDGFGNRNAVLAVAPATGT